MVGRHVPEGGGVARIGSARSTVARMRRCPSATQPIGRGTQASRAISGWCSSSRRRVGCSTPSRDRCSTSPAGRCWPISWDRKAAPSGSGCGGTRSSRFSCSEERSAGWRSGRWRIATAASRRWRSRFCSTRSFPGSRTSRPSCGTSRCCGSWWRSGVGGEWAVGATLVAEVFPARARARASGIFHATSVLGTWLAAAAGLAVGSQWRYAYIIGVLPALLVLWVRSSIHEPERWQRAAPKLAVASEGSAASPNCSAWRGGRGRRYSGCCSRRWASERSGASRSRGRISRRPSCCATACRRGWRPSAPSLRSGSCRRQAAASVCCVSARWPSGSGRRGAFALMHLAAFAIVPVICYVPQTYGQMLCILPVFGFFTLASHAGYAVYFPGALSRSPARHRDERMLQRRPAGGGSDPVVVRHAQRTARNGPSPCRHDAELVVSGGPRSADLPARDKGQAASRIEWRSSELD